MKLNQEVKNIKEKEDDEFYATLAFCRESDKKIREYRKEMVNHVREKLFIIWEIKNKP